MMGRLGLLAGDELKPASEPGVPLAIHAISAQETNLVFDVTIPAGLGQVVLEVRPSVDTAWEEPGCQPQRARSGRDARG